MVTPIREAVINRVQLTGGVGVSSLNSETGAITLTSSGGTVTITTPSATTINLESVGSGSIPQSNFNFIS